MDHGEKEELKEEILRELRLDASWREQVVNQLLRELKKELVDEIRQDYAFRRSLIEELRERS